MKRGVAASKEKALELHKAYNQAVTEVAESRHWLVLDLEQEIGSLSNLSDIFFDRRHPSHSEWPGLVGPTDNRVH